LSEGNRDTLLLWGNPKERQTIFRILAATGADVVSRGSDLDGETAARKFGLVVVDYDSMHSDVLALLDRLSQQNPTPAVLVVTQSRDKHDIGALASHSALTNLIAKNTTFDPNDLIITVQKLINNDIFGLEKYLTWGVKVCDRDVTSSSQKNALLDEVQGFLSDLGCNNRIVDTAVSVADEFFTNAVYNAPVDATGHPKYASLSRTRRVDLETTETVKFRFACDGRTFGLSAEDKFGRLEKATVQSYLRKCMSRDPDQIDEKAGGAGLGFYQIFESLNAFVVNVSPYRRTELIGLMDVSGTYRTFADRPKSLHLFFEQPNNSFEQPNNGI
jgi:CheY-like chemotaxis protein